MLFNILEEPARPLPDSDRLRHLFEMTVSRCIQEGLVDGEGFAMDASLIKADANRQRGVPGTEGLPPDVANHAVREYLEVLDEVAFGTASPVTPKYAGIEIFLGRKLIKWLEG